MSTTEYARHVPYWVRNRSREDIVAELSTIAEELAQADDGRRLLSPSARRALEEKRRVLKMELAAVEARQPQEEEAPAAGNVNDAEVAEVFGLARALAVQVEEVAGHLDALGFQTRHGPESRKLEFMDPSGGVLSVQGSMARQFAATK